MDARLELVKRYLRAIEDDTLEARMEEFFVDDVAFVEHPNRLVPSGARRNLAGAKEGAARGRRAVRGQRYEVLHAVVDARGIALEVDWSAELLVPVGTLAAGQAMRAHFAVFFTFRDGRIASQNNYDCFEPF